MERIDQQTSRETSETSPVRPKAWQEPTLRFCGNFTAMVQAHAKSTGQVDGGGFKSGFA